MKRIETGNAERIEYRESIGWGPLFVIPLMLGGLLFSSCLMFGSFGLMQNAHGGIEVLVLLLVVAIQFRTLWYFTRLLVRRGLVLDRATGVATSSWGLLVPVFGTEHPLTGALALRAGSTTIVSGRARNTYDVLYLVKAGGEIELVRMETCHGFRNLCEDAAALLKLDVVSVESGEVKILRRAEEAGKNVMELHAAEALEDAFEKAPAAGGLQYQRTGNGIRLDLRSSGGVIFAIYLFIAAAALLAFGVFFFSEPIVWGKLIVAVFFGIPLLILYPVLKPERTFVEARAGMLEVVRKGLVFSSRKAYPAASIRTLEATERCLRVDAREGAECILHESLSAREREWVRKALLAGLAAKA
ncbi:MAG: hypothetical protein HY291_00555 [Planctomycetes bacterium]|nr:hypothetical protein [Planctomycetota bacterium]